MGNHVLAALLMAGLALIAMPALADEGDEATGYVSLLYAVENDNEVLVEALLERGARPRLPRPDGEHGTWSTMLGAQAESLAAPLTVAVQHGNVAIVRMLLKHKPWVDQRCCDAPTALSSAVARGNVEIVKLLLDAGADPALAPLESARNKGQSEIVELLEAASRKWAEPKPARKQQKK